MIITVILFLLIGFVLLRIIGSKSTKTQYQTSNVERGTIISSISASGQILTANVSNISTSATGVVTRVYVKDGDVVTSGQKIADITLDTNGAQKNAAAWSSYLSAKNAVDSANVTLITLQSDMFSKWDTFKTLAASSAYQNSDQTPRHDQRAAAEFHIADDNWLAAEAKYKNQQAVITQSQAALNSSWMSYQSSSPTISAPMSGTISNITIVPGMTLTTGSTSTTETASGTRIAVIKSEGKPLIFVNLSEIDVPKVVQGQKTIITVDAIADKTFTGSIVSVDRIGAVSNSVTNYPAIILLDTNVPELLPNMAVTANIILDTKANVLLVPSAAIQTQNGQPVIRVLKNGIEQDIPVETGLTSDTQTEVISGVKEGDEVITGTISSSTQNTSTSVFGGFGGGAFRAGGGQRR